MSLLKLYYKDLNIENSRDNINNIPKKYNKNIRYYYNSLDNNINVQKKKEHIYDMAPGEYHIDINKNNNNISEKICKCGCNNCNCYKNNEKSIEFIGNTYLKSCNINKRSYDDININDNIYNIMIN
jgi:hypothetical protein